MKKKYRCRFVKRVQDYNKEARKYQMNKKLIESLRKVQRVYEYGGNLQAGNNCPNSVSRMFQKNKDTFVKGDVKHSGREHKPIKLEEWHKAVPNTATKSFTITGNID